MPRLASAFLILTLFLQGPLALGATVALFTTIHGRSEFVANYDEVVAHLRPQDRVVFTNGQSYVINQQIGMGATTRVFSLVNDSRHILRLPISMTNDYDEDTRFDLNSFLDGQAKLKASGIPVVKVSDHLRGEYIIAERLEANLITFRNFFESYQNLPRQLRDEAIAAMDTFAESTYRYEFIGDLHAENLVYEPHAHRWIVMDLNDSHVIAKTEASPPTLRDSIFSELNAEILPEMKGASVQAFLQLTGRWKTIISHRRKGIVRCESTAQNNRANGAESC